MYAFSYHKPTSLKDAAALLSDNPDAKFLSGGHTLLPAMKLRLAGPSDLVDLNGIAELRGLERKGDMLSIGALMRHREVAESNLVKAAIPTLAEAVGTIGDPAVRHRGTIGGSIANNDPSADYAAAALADGEIITQVSFPIPAKAGYSKMPHPASRFALTGVFVVKTKSGDVRVAATGASSSGVMRVPAIESALKANWAASALDSVNISADGLLTDIHGSSTYRANLIKVMAQRAVTAAG